MIDNSSSSELASYPISIEANIKMGSPIKEIRSLTHSVSAVTLNYNNDVGLKVVIQIILSIIAFQLLFVKPFCSYVRFEETSLDRDLVVFIKVADPNKPRLILEVYNLKKALNK